MENEFLLLMADVSIIFPVFSLTVPSWVFVRYRNSFFLLDGQTLNSRCQERS